MHFSVLNTERKDLLVMKHWKKKKVGLEKDGEEGFGITVATTNKYFIVLLCGGGYARSSCLTVSQVNAGFSEMTDWWWGEFHHNIVVLFWPGIQCQMAEATASYLLERNVLVSSCFLQFLWKQRWFGHLCAYMCLCVRAFRMELRTVNNCQVHSLCYFAHLFNTSVLGVGQISTLGKLKFRNVRLR